MTSSERELLELIAKWRGQEEDAGPNEDYDAGIERGYGRAADELEKLLAAAPAPTPAPPTILYESATSGLRYANPLAAGDISAVVVDGKVYRLVPAEPVVPEREPLYPIFHTADQERAARVLKGIVAIHSRRIGFSSDYPDLFLADIIDYFAAEFAEVRLAAAPRAAGGQRPSNQSVHRLAQRFAKQITEFPNELREWQEVRWGTPRFETVVNWFERELNAALAAAEPQVADGNLKRHLEATERRKRTIEREEPQV